MRQPKISVARAKDIFFWANHFLYHFDRMLAKLLGKQPLRIGHLFLGSLSWNACLTAKNCVLQTASNADTVAAAGESIWQGLAKSDQIFKRLYSHPRWGSAPKPRFWNINMIVRSNLHHPGQPCSTDLESNGQLLLGLRHKSEVNNCNVRKYIYHWNWPWKP